MKHSIIAIALILMGIYTACEPQQEPDIIIENDTLVQSLSFNMDNNSYNFIESDLITFQVTKSYGFSQTETNSCFVEIYSYIMVENKDTDGSSWYEHYGISFFLKLPKNNIEAITSLNPLIRTNILNNAIKPGSADLLKINCNDSLTVNPQIGFSFLKSGKEFISYNPFCSFHYNISQDQNAFVNIEKVQQYQHKQYGNCLLLSGTFNAKVFYLDGAVIPADPLEEEYTLENGSFRILIAEDDQY